MSNAAEPNWRRSSCAVSPKNPEPALCFASDGFLLAVAAKVHPQRDVRQGGDGWPPLWANRRHDGCSGSFNCRSCNHVKRALLDPGSRPEVHKVDRCRSDQCNGRSNGRRRKFSAPLSLFHLHSPLGKLHSNQTSVSGVIFPWPINFASGLGDR